jgi:hypothetical protein
MTGKETVLRWRLFIFFTPRDDRTTLLTTFVFTKARSRILACIWPLVRWLLGRNIDHEIRLDMRMLEGLADQHGDMEGMKLSRFDKALALNRERLNRVYRGLDSNGCQGEENGVLRRGVPVSLQREGVRP